MRCMTSAAGSGGQSSTVDEQVAAGATGTPYTTTAAPAAVPVSPPTCKIQIAVVGSGPSGCFVASYLTRKHPTLHVDIYERLPVPFGLCRYGVAPDHPDVKNVEKQFMELFKGGRVTWIGNVTIGRDIPPEALLQHYAAVVFATGADTSKKLNLPGEDLGGVLSARDLVAYYNTLPFPLGSPRFCPFDLERVHSAVVIGNGNVAIDVVRVLSSSSGYFAPTDMNCVAVKELMKNKIRHIDVVARRGVEHSAFTIAEFRELATCQPDTVRVVADYFDLPKVLETPGRLRGRAFKRLMELIHQHARTAEETAAERQSLTAATDLSCPPPVTGSVSPQRGACDVRFRYHMRPIKILPSLHRKNHVGGVLFEYTDGEARHVVIPCNLVLTSVGYRSDRIPGLPFDESAGVIPNIRGRVEGLPRVYCAGWVRNGAKGVILHSVNDAQDTVASILEDLQAGILPTQPTVEGEEETASEAILTACMTRTTTTMHGKYGLLDYFVEKRLEPVSLAGLQRILHVETQRGIDLGKRAEKIANVRDMLDLALGGEVGKKADESVRGIASARPQAFLYLKELLDDDTDLREFAKSLAKDLPHRLAAEHPPGPIGTSQL